MQRIEALEFPQPERVFTRVFERLNQSGKRFLINYGGTGSSKSFSAAQKEVLISIQKPVNTLIIRKVAATLKDSVIPSFKRRITEFDLWDIFEENKSDREITCTQTGSKFMFRGLDDPEKMKSIEGINRIMIEEASELDIDDFFELNRRVRGEKDIQITINFNPIHEDHWLKKHFFDQQIPNCEIIHSTYFDNPFLTKEDKEQIEWLKMYNYNQYRIYALGEWGLTENNLPWAFAFDENKHTADVLPFYPSYPVYLTFDFNNDPLTCIAFQKSPDNGTPGCFLHYIHEFSEDISLNELCLRIKTKYPYSLFFVTGDASGKNADVGFENKNESYYTMIQAYLGLNERMINTNGKNLDHNDSRNICNMMLSLYPNIKISKAGCPKLIKDFKIATVDEKKGKGQLKKDRDIYKMDLFDGWRYSIQTYFLDFINKVYLQKK